MLKSFAATLLACTLAAAPAHAQFPAPAPNAPPPPSATALTGDWSPRRQLEKDGIALSVGYISESAATLSGGRQSGSAYAQEVNMSGVFDLGRLAGMNGGIVKAALSDREGVNLSATKIGSVMAVQEINAGGLGLRPAELSYAQDLASARFNIKAGLIHESDDFASSPINCNFQNSAFCPRPPMLMTNSGYAGYPTPRWGLRLRWNVSPRVALQTGVYEVNTKRALKNRGWDLGLHDHGAYVPAEVTWRWLSAKYPGVYRLGGYYDSSKAADVADDINGRNMGATGKPAEIRSGRSGYWLMGEQRVWSSGPRNLTLFSNVLSADRQTARYGFFYNVGAVARGVIPARPADTAGFAFGTLDFNDRLTDMQLAKALRLHSRNPVIQTQERAAEIFYGVQATRWLMVRPNLQYIMRPGAAGLYRNAAVAGLTIRASL